MIKNRLASFASFVVTRKHYIFVLVLCLSLPAGYYTAMQKHDNHLDAYFEDTNTEWIHYKDFQRTYGNDELEVVIVHGDNLFTKKNIQIIRDLTEAINGISGVNRVTSITEAESPVNENGDDTVNFMKFFPEKNLSREGLEKGRKRIEESHLIQNYLISEDAKTAAVVVLLDPLSEKEKINTSRKIFETAKKIIDGRIEFRVAGIPVVEADLNAIGVREGIILGSATYIMIFIVILLLLKDFTLAILAQVNLLVTFLYGIGLFVFCGETFNMVTVSMGVVLLAICIADDIHLLVQYKDDYEKLNQDPEKAIKQTIKHVFVPCLFTTLTTAVGFLSFVTGTIRPTRIYGIFTATGVITAFFLTMAFLPSLVLLFHNRIHKQKGRENEIQKVRQKMPVLNRVIDKIGVFSIHRHKAIGFIGIFIVVFSIMGIAKIRFETNLLAYFPEDNKTKQDYRFIENNLGGVNPVIMRVKSLSDPSAFNSPANLMMIDDIQQKIMERSDYFSSSISIADVMKEIHMAFNNGSKDDYTVSGNELDIADYYELAPGDIVDRLVSPEKDEAIITFMTKWKTLEVSKGIFLFIDNVMKNGLENGFRYELTGYKTLFISLGDRIKESQLRSLVAAVIVIFVMMLFVCRSFSLTLIAMIPNLLPIIMTYGIMGWMDIPLDLVTLMIGSIVMGIAVDDTIHFIVWLRRNVQSGLPLEEALLKTYKDVGKPIVITTVILFMGFIICILGTMVPTKFFGVLVAFSLLFALLGDIFMLPSLILIFRPKI
ncbi:MAG: MMPL family transporter [Proteobacteria bacterium]|nr:MMPL family transporter [Pseudomonadota bacterium]